MRYLNDKVDLVGFASMTGGDGFPGPTDLLLYCTQYMITDNCDIKDYATMRFKTVLSCGVIDVMVRLCELLL